MCQHSGDRATPIACSKVSMLSREVSNAGLKLLTNVVAWQITIYTNAQGRSRSGGWRRKP
jgi:hypothetical protein